MENRLIAIRERLPMTQTEMAFFLGISQQKYSRYEVGAQEMKASTIWDICDQFGCSADWLLGRVPDDNFQPCQPKYPRKLA